MTNCLVTKLKGVVDNDNLEKLGEIVFDVFKTTNPVNIGYWMKKQNTGSTVKLTLTDGVFYEQQSYETPGQEIGSTITLTDSTYVTAMFMSANSGCKLHIENFYDLVLMAKNGTQEGYHSFLGNGDKLKFATSIISINATVYGNLNSFKDLNLESLVFNTDMTGDWLDFIRYRVESKGVTTYSLAIVSDNYSNTTLNGIKVLQFGWSQGASIKWDVVDGQRIRAYVDVKAQRTIWYYGYTAEEVAANRAAGGIWENYIAVYNCN